MLRIIICVCSWYSKFGRGIVYRIDREDREII